MPTGYACYASSSPSNVYTATYGATQHAETRKISPPRRHTAPRSTHEYCIWDIHDKDLETYTNIGEAIQNHITFNAAPLIVVSRQDCISGLKLVTTIPKKTMQINTGAFWKGRRRSGHKTSNTTTLYIHMTPDCPKEEAHTVGSLRGCETRKPTHQRL